jgi:hypothetical protein
MKNSFYGRIIRTAFTYVFILLITASCSFFCMAETDGPWSWSDGHNDKSVTLLLLGDFNVQKREDPASALVHVDKDIPGKNGWQHPGPKAVQALKAGNIQAVGTANNVAYGSANIMKSLSVLDANGIAHTGTGSNIDEAHQPAIVEHKGVRFGFLQYTAKWYEEEQIAKENSPGAARILSKDGLTIEPSDLNRLIDDIHRLRPLVDIVIVSSHTRDGQNRVTLHAQTAAAKLTPPPARDLFSRIPVDHRLSKIEPYQRVLAHAAIDAGADVVFGHGCHMLQAVEIYEDKPVMYCMGNFASDWIRVRNYKDGMVARVVVQDNDVKRVSLVPVTRDDDANNVRMLDPSMGKGAELFQELKDLSPEVPLKINGQEVILIDK